MALELFHSSMVIMVIRIGEDVLNKMSQIIILKCILLDCAGF